MVQNWTQQTEKSLFITLLSLTVVKEGGNWKIAALHFSTLTGLGEAGTKGTQ
jgi:hypothetical protein